MSLIRLVEVSKTYDRRGTPVSALRKISLSIDAGSYIAVSGPSGSGKSTLLQILGLLITPTTGTVIVRGDDTAVRSVATRAAFRHQELGFVFQHYQLVPDLDAQANVERSLFFHPMRAASRRRLAAAALAQVGLGDRSRHRPAELSGGEQQRVAIARAIVRRPSLLLADEPTGNLDPDTATAVMELLEEFCAASGAAMVIVTHDPAIAQRADTQLRLG